jgi:hypothetical protein
VTFTGTFWLNHDATEYVDWKKAKKLTLANKRDVPYQSLVKGFLSDRIEQELAGKQRHTKSSQRTAMKSGSQ